MSNSTLFNKCWLTGSLLLLIALPLQGCGTQVNLIQGVSPVQPIPAIGTPVSVIVTGSGRCREMDINWGDGSRNTELGVDLGSSPAFTHTFKGIGGGKTITVEGTFGCEGKVNTRFDMEPSVFQLGFNQIKNPSAQTCTAVANFPGLITHNLIHIITIPASPGGINFGCPFRGCIYDADGRPGSVADSTFPFPGLKEYSLVLRVSSQVVQGGTNMQFTTTDAGSLEVCLNDSDMTNNTGGYEIDISVDQLGP